MMPTWKWLKYGNLWAKFDEEKKGESKDETTNELQNISMDFQLKLTAAICVHSTCAQYEFAIA